MKIIDKQCNENEDEDGDESKKLEKNERGNVKQKK